MPLFEITHRDPANREIIATEEPIEASDGQAALLLFMAEALPKNIADAIMATPSWSSGQVIVAAYDRWMASHGKGSEGALSDRLEAHEVEVVPEDGDEDSDEAAS